MNDENITENNSSAEPRFKVGDVVWTATTMLENDNPVFIKSKILALYYIRANGKSVFSGYKIIDNGDSNARKPEAVFATKEECELFIDSVLAPEAKKIMESLRDLGESAGKRSNEEEEWNEKHKSESRAREKSPKEDGKMNYDTTELFAEINAYRRRNMARKIARGLGIAAGVLAVWVGAFATLDGLFFG